MTLFLHAVAPASAEPSPVNEPPFRDSFLHPENKESNLTFFAGLLSDVGALAAESIARDSQAWKYLLGLAGSQGLSFLSMTGIKDFLKPSSVLGISCERPKHGGRDGCPSGHQMNITTPGVFTSLYLLHSYGNKKPEMTAGAVTLMTGLYLTTGYQRMKNDWHTPGQIIMGLLLGAGIGAGGYYATQAIAGPPTGDEGEAALLGGVIGLGVGLGGALLIPYKGEETNPASGVTGLQIEPTILTGTKGATPGALLSFNF